MHPDREKYIEEILREIKINLEKNPELFCNFLKSFQTFIEDVNHSPSRLKNCSYFFSRDEENPRCQYNHKCPYRTKTSDKGCYFMEFLKPVMSGYFLKNHR